MKTGRSKVTTETKEEARRLLELWKTRPHSTQAQFGEEYEIGNQSAVGQFLRGEVPLSLKAARGFAKGLGCRVEDFSQRLADEAATIANMVPGDNLTPEVSEVAREIDRLPPDAREFLLRTIRGFLRSEHERNSAPDSRQPKRKQA